MKVSELRERWTPDLADEVNSLLGLNSNRKGGFQQISGLPSRLGRHEERIDIRGLEITVPLKGLHLDSWDFSYCSFRQFGQFSTYNHVTNCKFMRTRLDTNVRDRFEGCDFTGANLRGAVLGEEFSDCTFEKANLSSVLGGSIRFTRCSFKEVKGRGIQMTRCIFTECDFEDADFSKGSLAGSIFTNCEQEPNLNDVML